MPLPIKISPEIVNLLEQFSTILPEELTPVKNMAKKLLSAIKQLNGLDETKQGQAVTALRKMLLKSYNNEDLPPAYIASTEFKKLLGEILITLAKHFPANEIDEESSLPVDPVTRSPIDPADQFHTLSGQIFSIEAIVEYNKKRLLRDDSLGESEQNKFLLNPLTNQPFHPIDAERLIIIAGQQRERLDFLIDQRSDEKAGHREFSKFLTFKEFATAAAKGPRMTIAINIPKELKYTSIDAVACIRLARKNEELNLVKYLYDFLPQSQKDLLNDHNKSEEKVTIERFSANAFICLAAIHNAPKTLREIADMLIIAGYNLQHQYTGGIAAIHLAARYGSAEAMRVLLDPKYGLDINLQDALGETAINIALGVKKNVVAKMLVEAKANIMLPHLDGSAPIHVAAAQNNVEVMELLLEHKAEANQVSGELGYKMIASHYAAKWNSEKVLKLLITKGADLSLIDRQGTLPLHQAVYFGSYGALKILLQHLDKFDINQPLSSSTPETAAGIAAQKGDVIALQLLAEAKADLAKPRQDDGTVPLHRAVLESHANAAAFLIAHYKRNNKSIFVKDKYEQSSFLIACAKKNWEIAKLFLKNATKEEVPAEEQELLKKFRSELNLPEKPARRIARASLFSRLSFSDQAKLTTIQVTDDKEGVIHSYSNLTIENYLRFCSLYAMMGNKVIKKIPSSASAGSCYQLPRSWLASVEPRGIAQIAELLGLPECDFREQIKLPAEKSGVRITASAMGGK